MIFKLQFQFKKLYFFLIFINSFPGFVFIAIIPILIIALLFSISLGFIIGISNVYFRDTGHIFTIIFQFWFWFTPIVYPLSALPVKFHKYIYYNPLTPVVIGFQDILVKHSWPDWNSLLYSFLLSLILLIISLFIYIKSSSTIVDEL